MSDFKRQALIHAAFLLLMLGSMAVARKPGMEVFYFVSGMVCMPLFGSLRDLFSTVLHRIQNS